MLGNLVVMARRFLFLLFCYFLAMANFASAKESIRLATFLEPPMIDYVDGQYRGEFIEIMELLAREMEITLTFAHCPIARCLVMMKSGDADIIIGVKNTEQRQLYLNYLSPHLYTQDVPLSFYTHTDNPQQINQYDDLQHKAIGVLRGAAYFEPFDSDPNITKVFVTRQRQLIDMLLKQRIHSFIEREESVTPLLSADEFKYLQRENYSFTKHVLGYIAISKLSPFAEQTDKFSTKLQELLDNGKIEQIFAKYQLHHH
jgi:polar amino acid transport system substrate-binding protein